MADWGQDWSQRGILIALVPSPKTVLRTLVVDDDDALRTLVRLTVSDEKDFEVVGEATNGQEAVAQARLLRPDLVLLDLKMPVMDGFQALPLIRQAAPGARVVCLSMLQRLDAEPKVLALGATGFIDKGLPSDAFLARLRRLLAGPIPVER